MDHVSTRASDGARHLARVAAIARTYHECSASPFYAWLGPKSLTQFCEEWNANHPNSHVSQKQVQGWIHGRRHCPDWFAVEIAYISNGQVPTSSWARQSA